MTMIIIMQGQQSMTQNLCPRKEKQERPLFSATRTYQTYHLSRLDGSVLRPGWCLVSTLGQGHTMTLAFMDAVVCCICVHVHVSEILYT